MYIFKYFVTETLFIVNQMPINSKGHYMELREREKKKEKKNVDASCSQKVVTCQSC